MSATPESLKVLVLEDDPNDEILLRRRFASSAPDFEIRRVATAEAFERESTSWRPDAVVSDYNLSGFTALDLLQRLRPSDPELPFIVFSGSVGDDVAAELLRLGASDFVLKDRPARLATAVRGAVQAAADRRAAREALQLSSQIIQSASVGIIVYGPDLRYQVWNPEMERMSGLPAASVLGRHPLQVIPGLRDAGIMDMIERARAGEVIQAPDTPCPVAGKNGWISQRFGPLRDAGGQLAGVIGTIRDVTQRHEDEQKVLGALESERVVRADLQSTLERLSDGFVALDRQWRYTYVNARAAGILGRRVEELLGRSAWDEFPEARGNVFHRACEQALSDRQPRTLVDYYAPWDRWFENRIYPSETGVSIFFRDVTAERRAEAALQESELRFRELAEHIRDVFWIVSPDLSKTLYLSPAYEEVFGGGREAVMRDPLAWAQAIHPDDREGALQAMRQYGGEGTLALSYRVLRADGTVRWIRDRAFPVRDESGRLLRIVGLAEDVTELKQAESELRRLNESLDATVKARTAELRESERQFRSLVATVPGVVYRCTLEAPWRMMFISDAVLGMTGLAPEEFMEGRRTWADMIHPEDLPRITALTEAAERENRPALLEYRILHADGSIRWVLESGRPVVVGPGGERYAEGVILDITSFKATEEALQSSEEERLRLEEAVRRRSRFQGLVGKSPAIQEVYRRLRLAGQSDVTVLLTGESGTGKELAAAAIHALSTRNGRPFVAVNCSAIPEPLLESELFGHVRGAFTGAVRDKAGLFQAAAGGTLFLDEVGDMPPALQVKVLRALQEKEIRRVGDEKAIHVDVRLVAATNRDLAALIARGAIREDFFYRIRVFEISLPPLRERREDIPLLAGHFLEQLAGGQRRKVKGIAPDAMRALLEHPWPGNVRELRNAIEHALVTVVGDRIRLEDLPREFRTPPALAEPGGLGAALAGRERIVEALRTCRGNRTRAAKLLGISRVTLWKRIREFGLGEPGEETP